jgi:hypothetical protein
MAAGARSATGAEVGIAVTGVAGPGGGTERKPVGLVYLHVSAPGVERGQEQHLVGDRAQVREWAFPPALYTSTISAGRPIGLVNLERGGKNPNALWCLLEEYHGALIQFLPGNSGLFTRFTTRVPDTPLIYPKDLKFDGTGNLWFIGSTVTNHVSTISRFDPATRNTTSWEVPLTAMLNLASIHPDRRGKKVWVSSVDPNLPSTRQWIGCLDVASGAVERRVSLGGSPWGITVAAAH